MFRVNSAIFQISGFQIQSVATKKHSVVVRSSVFSRFSRAETKSYFNGYSTLEYRTRKLRIQGGVMELFPGMESRFPVLAGSLFMGGVRAHDREEVFASCWTGYRKFLSKVKFFFPGPGLRGCHANGWNLKGLQTEISSLSYGLDPSDHPVLEPNSTADKR
jgi:hypothetical protein